MLESLRIKIFIDTCQTFSVIKPLLQCQSNTTDYSKFVTL